MTPSFTAKLFAAMLGIAVAVALAMGLAAHVNLTRGFVGYLNAQAEQQLDLALPGVIAGFRSHGDWVFLRTSPGQWGALLQPATGAGVSVGVDVGVGVGETAASAQSAPSPGERSGAAGRFTLFDAEHRRVAGSDQPAAGAAERPVVVDGRIVGWLAMAPLEQVSRGAGQRFADDQLQTGIAVGLGAVLLAAGLAWAAARALLSPVERLAAATHRLAAGDYATRVDEPVRDELGQLARDFNRLARTLQRNEQMRREFMADVSHELRTPLGVLHGELEALEDGVRTLDAASLRSLQGEVATLNKLVGDLYELSLADVGALSYRMAELDVGELLADTAAAFGERLEASGLQLDLQLPTRPLLASGDERRLQQLFNNLFENSCRYTDAGGRLRVRAHARGQQILIDLIDSAPGVGQEHLHRIFDRFFRVEGSRNRSSGGAGLGLSICRRIVEAHDGTIEARPSPLGGLWLAIALPKVGP